MFVLEGPYISDFIENTLIDNKFKVIDTPFLKSRARYQEFNLVSEKEAVAILEKKEDLLYSNSENVIEWVQSNLKNTKYPSFIELFKNKVRFREVIQSLFPDFYFQKIKLEQLKTTDVNEIPFPVVIKPSVGFFSLGVYTIEGIREWLPTVERLENELLTIKSFYLEAVVNTDTFIVEKYIDGKEYAVDCYFNKEGEAVILNILEHQFSSAKDVSDRLYFTSKNIIKNLHDKTLLFLNRLSELTGIKNFPLHLEMRVTSTGEIIPIEGNPMRFGGWCTTADLAHYAYGINAYELYQHQQKPNWEQILKTADDSLFSLIILDNSTGLEASEIKRFDYEKLLSQFKNPLELRKVDVNQYPLFGYVYTKTHPKKFEELSSMLTNNLSEFIALK